MPDTTILESLAGWYDRDDQSLRRYRTRREARDARRRRLATDSGPSVAPATPAKQVLGKSWTGLQRRAFNRLIGMGVDRDNATDAVEKFGYNAAVSYGHMRQAGATDAEAWAIVLRGDQGVSLRYGQSRANGASHEQAANVALRGAVALGFRDCQ